jgi:hypothetical protein
LFRRSSDWFYLSVLQPDPNPFGVGKCDPAAGVERNDRPADFQRAEELLAIVGLADRKAASPTACRAASSSGWRLRARWCTIRCWCWRMSRPATWMKKPGGRCWNLLERLTRQAGKSMMLVTHSLEAAAIADRVFAPARRAAGGAGPRAMSRTNLFSSGLWNVGWRYLLVHRWQSLLMVLGIALGVAVVISIDLANASAGRAFELSTETITGRTTHQIEGGPWVWMSAFMPACVRERPLSLAAPVISEYVTSPQLGSQPMQLLGIDPFADAPFRSFLGQSRRPGNLPDLNR